MDSSRSGLLLNQFLTVQESSVGSDLDHMFTWFVTGVDVSVVTEPVQQDDFAFLLIRFKLVPAGFVGQVIFYLKRQKVLTGPLIQTQYKQFTEPELNCSSGPVD